MFSSALLGCASRCVEAGHCCIGDISSNQLPSCEQACHFATLVKSEAAAMANAKKAGLGLAERNKLREALRRHKDNVLSAVDPQIVEVGDDAEAHHIIAAQHQMMEAAPRQMGGPHRARRRGSMLMCRHAQR